MVLPRLPTDLHPLVLYHWFTRPNPDLVTSEEPTPMSPRDWLRFGLDPKEVADLAAEH